LQVRPLTEFADLIAQPGERHLIYGGTRAGKSSFIDWEMREIQRTRPMCMQVLIDSKPRFRAETERMPIGNPKGRRDAAWRYRHWQKGPVVPGSVLVDIHADHPFRGLWTRPGEIAIMQSGDTDDWRRMLELLMAFVKAQIGERERHITADEVLDFYGRNTWSIHNKNDVFYLAARSGGERNIGESLGSQRVFGLPILIRNMFSRATLFNLTEAKDVKYLEQNGIPNAEMPQGNYIFHQWTKQPGGTVSPMRRHTLDLPDSYLSQLAAA
jgi:hypothetical protein